MSEQLNAFSKGRSAGVRFAQVVRQHSSLEFVEGCLLVVFGLLAILLPKIASVAVTLLLGWLFLIGGLVGMAVTIWTQPSSGLWWSLTSGVVSIVAGLLLLAQPATGLFSLTIVVIAYFLIDGIISIMYSVAYRHKLAGVWILGLSSGILTLVIGVTIWIWLPFDIDWVIGWMAGIDMIIGGSALMGVAVQHPFEPHSP